MGLSRELAARRNQTHPQTHMKALPERIARVSQTGKPLRITTPSGQKVRVTYADGYLRVSTVANQQAPAMLVIESNDPASVAKEISESAELIA